MNGSPELTAKNASSTLNYCRLCLTKQELSEITSEKFDIIRDTLTISLSPVVPYRLCKNCNNAISCLEKFKRNCLKADYVLRCGSDSAMRNTFLTCNTDESLTIAFNTIQNWLTDVGILLRHLDDVVTVKGMVMKAEEVQPVLSESETEIEALHEEEIFVFDSFTDKIETATIDEDEDDEIGVNFDSRSSIVSNGDSGTDSDNEKLSKFQELQSKRPSRTKRKFDETLSTSRKLRPKEKKLNLTPENSPPLQDSFRVDDYFDQSKVGSKRPYKCGLCHKHYCRSEFTYHMNQHWSKYAKMPIICFE